MINAFCEAGSKVSVVVPTQQEGNAKDSALLLHNSAMVFEVPEHIFPEAERGDLAGFLGGRSFGNFAQRSFAFFLNGDKYPAAKIIHKIPHRFRLVCDPIFELWSKHALKIKKAALAKGEYWHLYFKQQLPLPLYRKYAEVFNLDAFNYFYFIKTLIINMANPIDCIYCNDLWSLPVGALIKELLSIPLIYDTHEIGTTVFENKNHSIVAANNEKWMYRLCDSFVTVNESISNYYKKLCPFLKPIVIGNTFRAPWHPEPNLLTLKKRLGLPPETPLAVYVGSLHSVSNLDRFIKAIPHCEPNLHLAIVGDGGEVQEYRRISQDLGLSDGRVFFLGKKTFGEISATIYGADFGIIPNIQNRENLTVPTPSKMYDYIRTGLPFISDHGGEVQKIIDQFKIGKTVDFQQKPREIADLLDAFYTELCTGAFTVEERQQARDVLVCNTNLVDIIYSQARSSFTLSRI